jgi:hypothetical protein
MTKEFCDICHAELTPANDTRYIHHSRCGFKIGNQDFRIEQLAGEPMDICRKCMVGFIVRHADNEGFWQLSVPE